MLSGGRNQGRERKEQGGGTASSSCWCSASRFVGAEKELLVGWIDGLDSAENEGDGWVGWIGRDPEENKVAAAAIG